jgi:hypothetical protein
MDYQGNSKKDKEPIPKKEIERVVTTEVVVKKKSIGSKFREVFIAADIRNVNQYIIYDVLIPAVRDTVVDAVKKGVDRMVYGESAIRRRDYGPGPRITTYNRPVDRGFQNPIDARSYPGRTPPDRDPRPQRHVRENLVLTTREEAALVLERMTDIIETYEAVSVADLNELVGLPFTPVDNKWGWTYLGDAQIQQIREGYLLNLPSAEPIQ